MKIKPDSYLKQISCLYVEDDASIREPFSVMIGRYFKEVYVASNGLEGVELYKKHTPDIILSDIRMPVMNGIEMVAKIKEEDPDAIVIFITAFSDMDNLKEAIDLGVDGYITKPVDKHLLIHKLNKLAGYIKHKNELNEYTNLLKEILDKQFQPIIVVEHGEIKIKNKAFEKTFFMVESFDDFCTHIPVSLTEGIHKTQIEIADEIYTYEITVQKIDENFTLISLNDITEFEEEIYTDQLTKVYNRKILTSLVPKLFGKKVYLTLLDIDNFKNVNDTYGHLVGDEVLKLIAKTLKRSLRKEDKVIRWGGEEFVVLFETIHDDTIAYNKAEYLRQKIESLEIEKVGHVTCSFGVCGYYIHCEEDFQKLLASVDEALYAAKNAGKNVVKQCHIEENGPAKVC